MPRPPVRSTFTLGGLIDSDSEQEYHRPSNKRALPASDSEMEISRTPIPRKRGRPSKASKAAEAAAAANSAAATKPSKSEPKRRVRPPLKSKANEEVVEAESEEELFQEMNGSIEETLLSGDELEASMISVQVTKPSKHVKASASKPKAKPVKAVAPVKTHRQTSVQSEDEDKSRKRRKRDLEEVPETQALAYEPVISSPPAAQPQPTRRAIAPPLRRPESVQRGQRQTSVNRHIRSGSYSDTEGHNNTLRRKVSDLTKKLDSVELRYRNLREVGLEQAEANFKALQRQSEESATAAGAVIEHLKAQLIAKSSDSSKEAAAAAQKQVKSLQSTIEEKDDALAALQNKLAAMAKQLSEAQAEAKLLKTRLAEERAAKTTVESMSERNRRPSSAKKPANGVLIMGSAEAAAAQQVAQLTIGLYTDLTGLIVRGVKREGEEDVFDCLQTGRNGSKFPLFSYLSLFFP